MVIVGDQIEDGGQVDLDGGSCVETRFHQDKPFSLVSRNSSLDLGHGSTQLKSKVGQQILEACDKEMAQAGGTRPNENKNGPDHETSGTRLEYMKERWRWATVIF